MMAVTIKKGYKMTKKEFQGRIIKSRALKSTGNDAGYLENDEVQAARERLESCDNWDWWCDHADTCDSLISHLIYDVLRAETSTVARDIYDQARAAQVKENKEKLALHRAAMGVR